jgi:hypothetical protein
MRKSLLVPKDLSNFLPYLPQGLRTYAPISMQATVLDYARFLIEMVDLRDAVERPGDQFRLSQTNLTQMLTPHIQVGDQSGLSWGLGW